MYKLQDAILQNQLMYATGVALAVFFLLYFAFYEDNKFSIFSPKKTVNSIKACYQSLNIIVKDFRARKFYKPWRASREPIIIAAKKQIQELSEATELSQRAVYADMFGFKYTMDGLEHNRTPAARSRLFSRLLQVQGPENLAVLFPSLKEKLRDSLRARLNNSKRNKDGWVSIPVAQTAKELNSTLMSLIFFGESFLNDVEFTGALLQYPRDMISSMAAFQMTPRFMSSFVHAVITKHGKAMRIIESRLVNEILQVRACRTKPEKQQDFTILSNMIALTEGNEYWTPEIMAQALLGIWFAAAHQPWMHLNFVLLELCTRPEYIELLNHEIGDFNSPDYDCGRLEQLPLLDSFIKETIRSSPLDTLGIRRKALQPFTFSNGVHVPTGFVACVSSYDLMHDSKCYSNPYDFNGHRFVSGSKLTDVSHNFPVWGYGSLACPGRFHASLVMKIVIAEVLSNFSLELENKAAPLKWSWETFTMPYESTRILLKEANRN